MRLTIALSCFRTLGALLAAPFLMGASSTGKLPASVLPLEYRLHLLVDPAAETFSGQADVAVQLLHPADKVILNGEDLELHTALVSFGAQVVVAHYRQLTDAGLAELDFPNKIPAGKAILHLDYTAKFQKTAQGLFHANVNGQWYAWTQLDPLDARRVFPCFDQLGFKTPFEVDVAAPNSDKVFSNTVEKDSRKASETGFSLHLFARSKPLTTYSMSIAVGPFDVLSYQIPPNATRHTPLELRLILTKGKGKLPPLALRETPKLLALEENYLGIPYPFDKLDLTSSPIMSGGQENPGLILFGDSILLINPNDPPNLQQILDIRIAHELAHQWFGNDVTPTWWTDIWLNESFADWMAAKIADLLHPDFDFPAMQLSGTFEAMEADSLSMGRAVRQPITDISMVPSVFDLITYKKGAQIIRSFEAYLGKPTFRRGVQLYLSRFKNGSADANSFFSAMEEVSSDTRIGPAMESFLDQTGIPLVRLRAERGHFAVGQSRYMPLGLDPGAKRNWIIPVCLGEAPSGCQLLTGSDHSLAWQNENVRNPIVPNRDGSGYYHFSLGGSAWEKLAGAASSLSTLDAMTFADSLWAEFRAGRAHFGLVIKAARALSSQPDWRAATLLADRLGALAETALPQDDVQKYRREIASIYGERLREIGFDPSSHHNTDEPDARRALREALTRIMALQAEDRDVRRELVSNAVAFIGGNHQVLGAAYRAVALQVAVQDLGLPFIQLLLNSNDPLVRQQLASALSAATMGEATDKVLSLLSSTKLYPNEIFEIISGLSLRRETRDQVLDFVLEHFDFAASSLPQPSRRRVLLLFGGYCSAQDLQRVSLSLEPKLLVLRGGTLELEKVRDTIRSCMALKAAEGADIDRALAG